MTTKQWKVIIGVNLLITLLVISPFLPGPSFLSGPTNVIFSLAQLGSILGFLLIPVGLVWTLKQRKTEGHKKILPILLCTVPALASLFSMWGSEFARKISRTIAMNNAGELINAIENYKRNNGQYPEEMSELEPDFIKSVPTPWVMGIPNYDYQKKAESFNLTFSQNVLMGFNFEVVIYDPTENHRGEGGGTILYDTENKKWKYYIYD